MAAYPRLAAVLRLGWRERALLAEAVIFVAAARLAVLLIPFRRLAPLLGAVTTDAQADMSPGGGQVAAIGRAVGIAARHVPWQTACLTEAIAAQWMLRRRRLPGVLHIGVRKDGDVVTAHAWISCSGQSVTGGAGAEGFTPLAGFGPLA